MSIEKYEDTYGPAPAVQQSRCGGEMKRAVTLPQEQDTWNSRVLALVNAMYQHEVDIKTLCDDMESIYAEAQKPDARQTPFLWNHKQKRYAEKLAEYNLMQREYTNLQQEKKKVEQIEEPQVTHAAKALLGPALFDNDKLWRLFYKYKVQWKDVIGIAEDIGFTIQSPLSFYFGPDVFIFSPPLNIFLLGIKHRFIDSSRIIDIIIESCIDPEEQQQLRFYYKYASLMGKRPGKNGDDIASVDAAPPVLLNSPDNDGDGRAYVPGDFIGQTNHPFNIQTVGRSISLQILGLFIAAVGIAAIAVAFIVLNAATFGVPGVVVAGVGLATTLGGFGLFKSANDTTNAAFAAIVYNGGHVA